LLGQDSDLVSALYIALYLFWGGLFVFVIVRHHPIAFSLSLSLFAFFSLPFRLVFPTPTFARIACCPLMAGMKSFLQKNKINIYA
jgi:hypothetical protein